MKVKVTLLEKESILGGSRAENKLYEEIKYAYKEVVLIGDVKGAHQALEAFREGFEAAMN